MTSNRVEIRQEFWDEFSQLVAKESTVLPSQFDHTDSEAPEADNWRSWNLPANARLSVNVRYDLIYIYLYLGRAETEPLFEYLQQFRSELKEEFGSGLFWRPKENRPQGKDKIQLRREADIIQNRGKWDTYQVWLLQNAEHFYEFFTPILTDYERKQR